MIQYLNANQFIYIILFSCRTFNATYNWSDKTERKSASFGGKFHFIFQYSLIFSTICLEITDKTEKETLRTRGWNPSTTSGNIIRNVLLCWNNSYWPRTPFKNDCIKISKISKKNPIAESNCSKISKNVQLSSPYWTRATCKFWIIFLAI